MSTPLHRIAPLLALLSVTRLGAQAPVPVRAPADSSGSLAPFAHGGAERLGRPLRAKYLPEVAAGALLASAGGAVGGGAAGFMLGPLAAPSERDDYGRRRLNTSAAFGGAAYGLALGSYAGAALGASLIAESRGCATYDARVRAFLGAAVGSMPLLLTFLRYPRDANAIPEEVSVSAPFLQIAGATLAVSRCRLVRELPPGESRGLRRFLGF